MRPANPETDQVARSLLQKAVRRGYPELALQVARYLRMADPTNSFTGTPRTVAGDNAWLRNRIFVIAAEENWPSLVDIGTRAIAFGPKVRVTDSVVDQTLAAVARSKKRKDAAGLGTLAFEIHKASKNPLRQQFGSFDSELLQMEGVRIVQLAIRRAEEKRPEAFWDWANRIATDQLQRDLLMKARTAHKRAGWPSDRAFALAAAYLAVREGVHLDSGVERTQPSQPFPYWVAVDRHTKQGKAALRMLAEEAQVKYEQIAWANFYFESTKVDVMIPTTWWQREIDWRFRTAGMSAEVGRSLWEQWRPRYRELVAQTADELEHRILDHSKL